MNIASHFINRDYWDGYWTTTSLNDNAAYVWECDINAGYINKALLKQESHPYCLNMYALKAKSI